MARLKPNPHIVADRAQAEGALAEMAALDRKIAAAEADMQESIDNAKARAAQACAPLAARRKELADAVAVYAKLNRTELFRTAKSLDMRLAVTVVVVAVVGVWVAGNVRSGSYVPLGQHEAEVLMAALGGKALQGFFEYGRRD